MYLLGEQPAYADKLINRLQTIPRQILQGLPPRGDHIEIAQTSDLARELADDQLFIIDDGLIHALVDGRPVFYLQEGDLIGLRKGLELPECQYSSEEPIRLTPYNRREVFQHIAENDERQELFTLYLLGHSALFSDALARLNSLRFAQPQASRALRRAKNSSIKATLLSMSSLLLKGTPKLGSMVRKLATWKKMRFSALWQYSQRSVVRPL